MSTTSRNDLLNRIVTLDLRLSRFDPAPGPEIDPLLDSMNADGSWTGIELVYSPTPRFPAMEHLNRIRRIARSWIDPRSSHYRDPSLPPDVIAGLQLWRKHDPFCTNWWSNDIGVPLALARILAYAQEYLPEDLARWCARRMRRSYRDGFFRIAGSGVGPDGTSPNPDQPATGQNTIWMAQSCLIAASYERDETLAELSIRAILDELVVQPCGKEGIQNDFSFHQHGALLYTGGYGRGFAQDLCEFAFLLQGTSHAVSEEKLELLADYLLIGHGWAWWGNDLDFGVVGREISRPSESHANGSGLAAHCELLAELIPNRADDLDALSATLRGTLPPGKSPARGNRHFYRSGWMVHRRPEFHASVRMTSDRLLATESGNGENPFGYHLGDGSFQLLRHGDEYRPCVALWNWRQIPGVTCRQTNEAFPQFTWGQGAQGLTPWAGGVSDGDVGAAAFRSLRDGVEAWKSWFFIGDSIVCLGAGIRATGPESVLTTIDQKHSPAPHVVGPTRPNGTCGWIWHDGVAYLLSGINPSAIIRREKRNGSTLTINQLEPEREVVADIFTLAIDHGVAPVTGSYACIIALADSPDAISNLVRPTILSNTRDLQVVADPAGDRWLVVFHAAGETRLGPDLTLAALQPALVIVSRAAGGLRLHAAHPEDRIRELQFTLNGNPVHLPINATPETAGRSEVLPIAESKPAVR